jgi:hypothetical protein
VSHAIESDELLYARGVFWMTADQGIAKVAPGGNSHRWYPLTVPGNVTCVRSLAAGRDGGIHALAVLYAKSGGAQTNVLFRIGASGTVSTSADNLLYFGYAGPEGSSGIARVQADGSLTLFPIAGQGQLGSFVLSRGNIYSNFTTSQTSGTLGRITPGGIITMSAFPATGPSTNPSALSVDKGGNLLVVVDNAYAVEQYFLYQFNVYTGHFNGPYVTGLPNLLYWNPVVAPDDNVWIVLPGTSNANYGQPIGFGIFERAT